MTGMIAEVIDDSMRLLAFLPEWSRFLQTVQPPSPFQTPKWLLTWWSHFGSGSLHVLVLRYNGRVVGVLPWFLHDWNYRRQLTLMGSGISDYLDPVFDQRYSLAIADAVKYHLANFSEWEYCDWQDLSADTPLRALAPAVEDTPCSRVPLAESFERFLADRPHGLKRNLRRYREKALALGALHFRVSSAADPHLLRKLIELHRARWQRSGGPGMIDANAAEGFVQNVAKTMAEEGLLRIFTLYFREQVAAIVLALRNESTVFSYLSAFDPEHEVLGLGRELLKCSLEHAHAERYHWWDFLRGNEEYKLTWGAQVVHKCRMRFDRSVLV